MRPLQFNVPCSQSSRRLDVTANELVIAGWTGRDRQALEAHIHELAELGVSAPEEVPVFYRVASSLLVQDDVIEVVGPDCSGEAEAVVVSFDGQLWLGLGSDHTDRKLERVSIPASKQACAKPLGRELWPLQQVSDHWDRLILRSYLVTDATRDLYQEGELGTNLSALQLIQLYTRGGGLPEGAVMFCGTLPVQGGLRSTARFQLELEDPVLHRSLKHSYRIRELTAGTYGSQVRNAARAATEAT